MAQEASGSQESVVCLRLMRAFRRVSKGMRRWQDDAAPPATAPLSPRHVAALEHLLDSPVTVGELASRLGLTLPTVSGVLADNVPPIRFSGLVVVPKPPRLFQVLTLSVPLSSVVAALKLFKPPSTTVPAPPNLKSMPASTAE